MKAKAIGCYAVALLAALAAAGCGDGGGLYPVSGKVTYVGGEVPTGEVCIVRFEPVAGTTAAGQTKGASGRIGADGSYRLTTLNTDDGAFAGTYKVVFTIRKQYAGNDTLVDQKFTSARTTPFEAQVTAGEENRFNFEIGKAAGT